MEAVTYSQVQELVERLPATKLPLAYNLLTDLVDQETDMLSPQQQFIFLSLVERRQILTEQAEQMAAYYEQAAEERQLWQSGDFLDAD